MLKFLKTDQDFAQFRSSRLINGKFIKIRVRYGLNQNYPRFGFIVPKKVIPRVVDRNLLKRRIKSSLITFSRDLKAADVIFYPQKELIKKDYQFLQQAIKDLFTKAKLWK